MIRIIQTSIALLFILVLGSCKKDLPAPLPVANFFVENNGCINPCSLYVYDQSQNAVKWRWDFDNGTTSDAEDDSTLYEIEGSYEIWLHVWNSDNVKDSIRKNIVIN